MQRALYSLLLRLALPAQALRHAWRGWRHPQHRGSLRAHLALGLQPRGDAPLWLHAASVGEVQAMAPLVMQLRAAFDEVPLLVTVGTATGLERARQRFAQLDGARVGGAPALTLMAAPWDLPGATRRFMDAVQPRLGVFIEGELWPNLLRSASQARVPLLLASARMSARSARRYRRWASGLMRETVRAFTNIGAQSAEDRERFLALGAAPGAVQCWGNLKFDFLPPTGVPEAGAALRSRFGPERFLWVAGSTHAGEEAACLEAHAMLRQDARERGGVPPLLVIAPRRPERFEEVARAIVAQGFVLARHADRLPGEAAGQPQPEVLLVDRLGELLPYYAAADAVFVGGSLVAVGGHNLLEPAALGKPVMAGPHTSNAPEVADRLAHAGGLQRVADAPSLAAVLRRWRDDPAQARATGEAAAAVVAANGGATTRALAAISSVLAPRA